MQQPASAPATEQASPPVLDLDGARATIRLNRPQHLNRLQPEDLQMLMELFDRIEGDYFAVMGLALGLMVRLLAHVGVEYRFGALIAAPRTEHNESAISRLSP